MRRRRDRGALHELVKAGKDARYLGASATYAWQFEKTQFVAAVHGCPPLFPCRAT